MAELKLYSIKYFSTIRDTRIDYELLVFAKDKNDTFEQFSKDIKIEKVGIIGLYEAEVKQGSVVWNQITDY
jgi:hypothetical protein